MNVWLVEGGTAARARCGDQHKRQHLQTLGLVHHCGYGERARSAVADRWDLDAEIHVVDDSLLNQPSPRLFEGVELLAERLHGMTRPDAPLGLSP